MTGPNLGFQYQAASARLTPEDLAALARVMVGYVVGPAAPRAPSAAEIAQFPVSLRYFQVPGVGPTVSRTLYVGHEDRQSGTGRFGNYFTHLLTARGEAELIGLPRPIALWRSPVWQEDAAPGPVSDLDSAPLGPDDAASARGLLSDPARAAWFAALHDWLGEVLADETRIVVLDDAAHGWAWIAAVTYGLPEQLASQISFDTFTGEPDRSTARLCVADLETDRTALSRQQLTGAVRLVDLRQPAPVPRGLLARSIAAGRQYHGRPPADRYLTLGEFSVLAAIEGPDPLSLEPADLPVAFTTLMQWLDTAEPHAGDLDMLVRMIGDAVFEEEDLANVSSELLTSIWRRVAEQRRAVPASAQTLALRLALTAPLSAVDAVLPYAQGGEAPSDVVGAAISLIARDDVDRPTQRDHLKIVARLGLVGVNSALDRRLAELATGCLSEEGVVQWLCDVASQPEDSPVIEQVLRQVSAAGRFDQPVLDLLNDPAIGRCHDRLCGAEGDFAIVYARAVALSHSRPEHRDRTLRWALGLASTPTETESIIELLYGGQLRPADLRELLRLLGELGRQPGRARVEEGWRMLEGKDPFSGDPAVNALAADLHKIDQSGGRRSIYLTIWLEQERVQMAPSEWIETLVRFRARLTGEHLRALLNHQVKALIEARLSPAEHDEMVETGTSRLGQVFVDCYWQGMTWALRDTTRAGLVAKLFVLWLSDAMTPAIADSVWDIELPKALGAWSADARGGVRAELGRRHGAAWSGYWDDWCEGHPPAGVLGRQFAKVRTRRPRG